MKLEGLTIRPSPYSIPFWDGCKNQVFMIQRCDDCMEIQFYPRSVCSHCWSMNISWIEMDRVGEIYSYTTVYRAPSAEFKDIVPYTLVYVKYPGNIYMIGYLMNTNTDEDIQIGKRVVMGFERVNTEVTLPVFHILQ